MTVAASRGMPAFYSEINPFMRLVIESKTNNLIWAIENINILKKYFTEILDKVKYNLPSDQDALEIFNQAFKNKVYYQSSRLIEVIALKQIIHQSDVVCQLKEFAYLALGSIAVECSELKRASDLRYRRQNEYLPLNLSVLDKFKDKTDQIYQDILRMTDNLSRFSPVTCLEESALVSGDKTDFIDLIITSPPYLNGTNYFRNTKIELWLTGFLNNEKDLELFRQKAMAAGINNISRNNREIIPIVEIESFVSNLEKSAYDSRIPQLVKCYFSDTILWLRQAFKVLKKSGLLIIDIGDSCFAGVHIPTEQIITILATNMGFKLREERLVRGRKSKDGSPLKQVLLIFEKSFNTSQYIPANKNYSLIQNSFKDYQSMAEEFANCLPHQQEPYSKRNWGHQLHSLCSYQGKLKPAIAHFLIKYFTSPQDIILDPMSGSGTIPLEAFLQGRYPVGNDLQELGFILTKAKVEKGTDEEVYEIFNSLTKYISKYKKDQDFLNYAEFGFNGKITDYFHPETYREILAARHYIKTSPCTLWGQALVYSCLLHILHGNRPYALSRCSHPVTPFKPSGDFEYRPLIPRLKEKIARMLQSEYPQNAFCGMATQLPFSKLNYTGNIDVVITSPPFADSTRFFIANWLRLWLTGWEPEDFVVRQEQFLEYKQRRNMDIYYDFFNSCAGWLKPKGRLILHVGKTASCNMAEELSSRAGEHFQLVYSFEENVQNREKFGITAQGATKSHQYLFFIRK